MSLAERVRKKRKELDLTQVQLAEKTGLTQQAINKIEDGSVKETKSIIELAIALSCDPLWLKTGNKKATNAN